MIFSSPIFLFLFLPVVLSLHPLFPGVRLKNLWLLMVSIIFYAWGEPLLVFLMLGCTAVNYLLGLWVERTSAPSPRKWVAGLAITLNLGLLALFKYSNFAVAILNSALTFLNLETVQPLPLRLPIGISFYTFHAISYIIDIYRRKSTAARNPADVALYIFLFPQLIAGPILRWSAMAPQIAQRVITLPDFAEGIKRFILGLSKKMLIANTLAYPASQIFLLPANELTPTLAWFGAVCFTLQIYFDFSGYSDMAIGMGRMFGFSFIENFNHPYAAHSVQDFWRRWHMSLSSWFRDYLYFPLGGSHCSPARNYFNLVIVFLLCGLWHGASWTFVIWGLYHGIFLILERTRFGSFMQTLPKPLRFGYTLLVIIVGWVLFRSESLSQAFAYLGSMLGFTNATAATRVTRMVWTNQVTCALVAGIILSAPAWNWIRQKYSRFIPPHILRCFEYSKTAIVPLLFITLFILCAAWMATGTYNPFIYYQF